MLRVSQLVTKFLIVYGNRSFTTCLQQPVTCPYPEPDGSTLHLFLFVISGFRHELDENCALLGCYAASSGNLLPTFRVNLSVQSSGVNNPKGVLDSWALKMGRIGCPEMLIRDYHYSLRNIPEERSSHLLLLPEYPFNVILPPTYSITQQTHIFSCYFLHFLVMLRSYVNENVRIGSSAVRRCVTLWHSGV
jgi:hypothetical protein